MRMWYIDIYFFLALSPKTGSTLYINLMLFKASSLAAQLKNVIADGSFSSPAKISVLPVTCATWGNRWPMDTLMWMWQHFSLSSVGGVLHLIRICLEWHLPTPAVVPESTFLPFSLSFFSNTNLLCLYHSEKHITGKTCLQWLSSIGNNDVKHCLMNIYF